MKERIEENRYSTANTVSSRSILSRSTISKEGSKTAGSNHFVQGESVSHSAMTPLDSLYKPAYPRYPTFPSIYQSKYAHDFQYIPWPAHITKREYTPPPDYSKFKVGKTRYAEDFFRKEPINNSMMTPLSRYRMNKPHPRIHNVQSYPDANRWIWSAPDNPVQIDRTSTTAARVRKWQRKLEPQCHRWNSR